MRSIYLNTLILLALIPQSSPALEFTPEMIDGKRLYEFNELDDWNLWPWDIDLTDSRYSIVEEGILKNEWSATDTSFVRLLGVEEDHYQACFADALDEAKECHSSFIEGFYFDQEQAINVLKKATALRLANNLETTGASLNLTTSDLTGKTLFVPIDVDEYAKLEWIDAFTSTITLNVFDEETQQWESTDPEVWDTPLIDDHSFRVEEPGSSQVMNFTITNSSSLSGIKGESVEGVTVVHTRQLDVPEDDWESRSGGYTTLVDMKSNALDQPVNMVGALGMLSSSGEVTLGRYGESGREIGLDVIGSWREEGDELIAETDYKIKRFKVMDGSVQTKQEHKTDFYFGIDEQKFRELMLKELPEQSYYGVWFDSSDNWSDFERWTVNGKSLHYEMLENTPPKEEEEEVILYEQQEDGRVIPRLTDSLYAAIGADSQMAIGVSTEGYIGINLMLRESSGMSNSSLQGDFYCVSLDSDEAQFATVSFDGSGGMITHPEGGSASNHTYTVEENGKVTTISENGEETVVGMTNGAVGVGVNLVNPELFACVKKSTNMTSATLSGEYYNVGVMKSNEDGAESFFEEIVLDGQGNYSTSMLGTTWGGVEQGSGSYALDLDGKLHVVDDDPTNNGILKGAAVSTDGNLIISSWVSADSSEGEGLITVAIKKQGNSFPQATGTMPAMTMVEGEPQSDYPVDPTPYFFDADGDPLIYMLTTMKNGAPNSSNTEAVFEWNNSNWVIGQDGDETGDWTFTVTATDPSGASATQSFAVTVTSFVDTDGDGVADADDPFPNNPQYSQDTDADGMADEWENHYFGTLNITSQGDEDQDGFSNLSEFRKGYDPEFVTSGAELDVCVGLNDPVVEAPWMGYQVEAGWNLIGGVEDDEDLQLFLNDYQAESIWTYTSSGWKYLKKKQTEFTGNLERIEKGRGYWVKRPLATQ